MIRWWSGQELWGLGSVGETWRSPAVGGSDDYSLLPLWSLRRAKEFANFTAIADVYRRFTARLRARSTTIGPVDRKRAVRERKWIGRRGHGQWSLPAHAEASIRLASHPGMSRRRLHNHQAGDPTPSRVGVEMTCAIVDKQVRHRMRVWLHLSTRHCAPRARPILISGLRRRPSCGTRIGARAITSVAGKSDVRHPLASPPRPARR